ncbi:MAG TPA: antibiotic biosynthesis monooxygenase [Candidatus Limnocylindrales bacterium]|nr:antibiotic biosynthesis monooxygenase [Candidatus Limnocylindrales bacterium]
MIERHISFDVKPGRGDDFVRFFTDDYRPPVLSFDGLIECSLLLEADSETRYQMVFRWEHPDNAVAWRVSEVHQGLQPALNALVDGMVITAFARVA